MKRTGLDSSAIKRRKIFLWILGTGAILLGLLLAFFLLLPSLINIEPLREKIIAAVSETVEAPLQYERIDLSFFPSPRVVIQQARLSGPGNASIKLESLTVYPKWSSLLKGKIQIALVHIEAPSVNMELPKEEEKKQVEKESWSPASLAGEMVSVLAQVTAKTGSLNIEIDKGNLNLCGISTTGTVEVVSQNPSLDGQTLARDRGIDSTVRCLVDEQIRMTGRFDLAGSFLGHGEGKALAQSLQGNYELTARKGRIDRFNLLSRIFAFLNVTEVLRGRLPDLDQKGFAYDSINVKADHKTGKVLIKEATLKGPSMGITSQGEIDPVGQKINLTVAVAPFRTIDYIISKIPLVRYVLGGTLISIPVKVTGDLKDPQVTPLSPSAVGSDFLGIVKRTLDLPFRMIHPFRPKGEEEKTIPLNEQKK